MERLTLLREELSRCCPSLELREGEPLSRYTSFRIGGPAALMAFPKTFEEAAVTVRKARELEIAPFFLGNGSNLLVPDWGYRGFVLKLGGEFSQVQEANGLLEAGAAVTLARLSNAALDRGLTGLEFAGGIPGSVGGGVTMNAGAYGGELSQVLRQVTVLRGDGQQEMLSAEDCAFGYRKSVFSAGEMLILKATFALTPGDRGTIKARMEELSAQRQSKQPLEYPSAGSMFKRPEGYFAAALIDQCGLKGLTVGGAQVSEKHAGFVVNKGGATYQDVMTLIQQVQSRVKAETGVELEMEVKILR